MVRPRAAGRIVAVALAGALALVGCTDAPGDPVASASPTESPDQSTSKAKPTRKPDPEPKPKLQPVRGKRVTAVFPLGGRPVLGLGGDPEPDKDAIDRAFRRVGSWLDRHLDRLQRTNKGRWGQVAAKGLANRKQRRPATTQLASRKNPVRSARYVMSLYHDGAPEYMTVRVEVRHPKKRVSTIGMVFVFDDLAHPTLTMFGPEPRKAAK